MVARTGGSKRGNNVIPIMVMLDIRLLFFDWREILSVCLECRQTGMMGALACPLYSVGCLVFGPSSRYGQLGIPTNGVIF